MTTIPLAHSPDQLYYSRDRVYCTSREGVELIEIDPVELRVSGRIGLPGKPVAARMLGDATSIAIVTDEPAAVTTVDLARRRVAGKVALPAKPSDWDVSEMRGAVTLPDRHSIARVTLAPFKLTGETDAATACGPVRFRRDGRTVLAGAGGTREIVSLDAHSGALLARLPMPISPSRLCFSPDGGQMFVSGPGEDAVTIVNPYQNEVDETILAGRTPGAMAVSARQNLLFVANPESGDVTILDIDTRRLSASVHVGDHPGEILLTPDGEYALVLDSSSGNVSVIRIATVLDHKVRTKPLFTVFPTATDARAALIVPFST